jgi:hypothetical protein
VRVLARVCAVRLAGRRLGDLALPSERRVYAVWMRCGRHGGTGEPHECRGHVACGARSTAQAAGPGFGAWSTYEGRWLRDQHADGCVSLHAAWLSPTHTVGSTLVRLRGDLLGAPRSRRGASRH